MEEISIKTIILTTLAVFVGWLLNEVSQYFRLRREDKRVIKSMVYYMLDLYHLFTQSNFFKITGMLKEELYKKHPELNTNKEAEKIITTILSIIIEDNIKPFVFEKIRKLEVEYEKIVSSFSSIDPFNAYLLTGKINILKFLEKYKNWMNEFQKSTNIEIKPSVSEISKFLEQEAINETKEEIRRMLILLSRKVNWIYWFRCKKTIDRMDELFDKEMREKIRSSYEWGNSIT